MATSDIPNNESSMQLFEKFSRKIIFQDEFLLKHIISEHTLGLKALRSIALTTLSLPIILFIISFFIDHNLKLPEKGIGLLEDWNILCMFLEFPIALIIITAIFSRFEVFIRSIPNFAEPNRVQLKEKEIKNLHQNLLEIMAPKGKFKVLRWTLIALGISFVIFNAYNRGMRSTEVYFDQFWTSLEFPLSYWVTNIYTLLVWGYISPIIIFKLLSIIIVIKSVCMTLTREQLLDLKPLSPDKAGGLWPLGRLSLSMSFISIPFFFNSLAYYFWTAHINTPFIIGIILVIGLAILIFFLPITFTHEAMANAKGKMQEQISNEFNKLNKSMMTLISCSQKGEFEEEEENKLFGRMKRLNEMYAIVDKIPVWPIDIQIIGQFLMSVILPIAIVVLDFVLKGN